MGSISALCALVLIWGGYVDVFLGTIYHHPFLSIYISMGFPRNLTGNNVKYNVEPTFIRAQSFVHVHACQI